MIIHAVRHNVEVFSGHIYRAAVCQMSAVIQIHTHNGISRIQDGKLNRHVGLCTGVGLYIGIITAKQLLRTFNGKVLNLVHTFTSAVISFGRIAFRILVGKHASHCRHYSLAHPVLGSDQLDMAVLPFLLIHNRLRDFRICLLHFIQRIHPFTSCISMSATIHLLRRVNILNCVGMIIAYIPLNANIKLFLYFS